MVARFLATSSTEMQSVAVGWQIYSITHRPLDLGLVGLAQFLPGICLFLIGGHVADRAPRQKIMQTCYSAFSLCSALLLALTLHRLTSVYPIYIVLLLNGVVRAFNAPAGQAILPLLVETHDFPNAVAWASSFFQVATVAGPIVGGMLYGLTGSPLVVYSSAVCCYFVAFLLLRGVHIRTAVRPVVSTSVRTVLEGVRYICRNKLILGAMSLDLFAVLLGGAVALLPLYAKEILDVGAIGLGILRSAPGFGAVVTAMGLAHWPLKRNAGAAMLTGVFLFGVFTIVFGLSRSFPLSLIALVLIGAFDMISVIVRHTMVQIASPDEMRGRVSAVNVVFISASNEIGQFESGITAQWFGAVPAVVIGGIGSIFIVIAWMSMFPALRRVNRLVPESGKPDILEEAVIERDAAVE